MIRPSALVRSVLVASAALGCSACSSDHEVQPRAANRGDLESGAVARVGSQVVTVAQVRAMVRHANVGAEEARSRLVFDALAAEGALSRGYDEHAEVAVERRAVLARALLESLRREAQTDPITEEQVETYTQKHWLDLDRPVARRTTHALVAPEDPSDAAQMAKAEEVAARIAAAVSKETEPEGFKQKAEAVDAEGMKVLVEDLPPVVRDGRVADLDNRPMPGQPTHTFDEDFVAGVFRIAEVGQTSKPVRSKFGSHVILLTGVQPENRLPFDKRKEQLTPEIRATRVHEKMKALVESLRGQTQPSITRNAGSILQLLQTTTNEGP